MDTAPADNHADFEIEVPVRAIEHYSYCPRQCAMVHVEQTFDDNEFTIRGRIAHERVDEGEPTAVRGVRVLRGIPIWSERLGLQGRADAVEMRSSGPYPVEYKVGGRHGRHADLQLCAQALCLEEMLNVPVPVGAVYYAALRRRHEVEFDAALRADTIAAIVAIRAMLRDQTLPPAPNDERCRRCAQINACLPAIVAQPSRLHGWQRVLFRPLPSPAEGDGTATDSEVDPESQGNDA